MVPTGSQGNNVSAAAGELRDGVRTWKKGGVMKKQLREVLILQPTRA